jgi:hypothetical protein
MIDATETEIRFTVQYFIYGQLNAINRSSRAGVRIDAFKVMGLVKPKRLSDGNGMPHTGLGLVRRHHIYMAQILDRFYQVSNTGGTDAVVIGNENNGFVFGNPGF